MKLLPAGPQVTKYSDWDEIIVECRMYADRVSWQAPHLVNEECR